MMTTSSPRTTTCHFCQIDTKRSAGQELTASERNYWMMWGCTCNDNGEAQAWMDSVTR